MGAVGIGVGPRPPAPKEGWELWSSGRERGIERGWELCSSGRERGVERGWELWSSGRERSRERVSAKCRGSVKQKAVCTNWWSGESFREEVQFEMGFEG